MIDVLGEFCLLMWEQKSKREGIWLDFIWFKAILPTIISRSTIFFISNKVSNIQNTHAQHSEYNGSYCASIDWSYCIRTCGNKYLRGWVNVSHNLSHTFADSYIHAHVFVSACSHTVKLINRCTINTVIFVALCVCVCMLQTLSNIKKLWSKNYCRHTFS